MRYITWFDQIGRDDIDTVGGKGANLGELTRAGVPVPPGFVVDTDAYDAFVDFNNLRDDIIELASRPQADDPAAYETAAAKIRSLFEHGSLPEHVAGEIRTAYGDLVRIEMSLPVTINNSQFTIGVAVRSSATAEDLPSASFAGQQESFLNVRGDEALLAAVKKCWASLWTARAIAYRARRGIDPADVALAIVVQQMVPADASGILFTANPVNGRRDQAVINAAWGLGEAIVGGQVTPDTIIVDKGTGAVVERETVDKDVMVVPVDGGTETQPVPEDRRRIAALDDTMTEELVRYGMAVEELYGVPQDIEWALVDGLGVQHRFAIVQTRPITALPEPEAPPPTEWPLPQGGGQYMRGSIADFMPDPLSPLFETLALPLVNANLNELILDLTDSRMSLEDGLVFTVNDYAYVGWSLTPRQWWVLLIGMAPKMLYLMRTAVDRMREARRQYAEVVERWEAEDLAALGATEMLAGVREILDVAFNYTTTLQSGTMGAAGGSEGLFTAVYDALIKRGDDPPAPTFLLGFDSTPIRAEKELYDLAMWSRNHADLADHLRVTTSRELADQLAGQAVAADIDADIWLEWRRRFRAYLDRYGHSIYDLDFAKPVPADDPTPILQVLKMFVAGEGANPYERQQRMVNQRAEAVAAVERRLDPLRLKVFRPTLDWAQRLAPLREDGIADIGLGWPRLREMLLELGWRLTEANAIERAGDIFWLRRAEVEAAAAALGQGELPADYRHEIRERQAVWRGEKRVTPPSQLPSKAKWMGIDMARWLPAEADSQAPDTLTGVAASPGQVTAPACVLDGPEDFDRMRPDHVLVAGITTPAWTPLFAMAAGIVTDVGGPLSHGSIVAREYGIPAVLGTGVSTQRIRSGQMVTVDGSAGVVKLRVRGEAEGLASTTTAQGGESAYQPVMAGHRVSSLLKLAGAGILLALALRALLRRRQES